MLKIPAKNANKQSLQENNRSGSLMFLRDQRIKDKSSRSRLKSKRKEVVELQREIEIIQTQLCHTIEDINAAKDSRNVIIAETKSINLIQKQNLKNIGGFKGSNVRSFT